MAGLGLLGLLATVAIMLILYVMPFNAMERADEKRRPGLEDSQDSIRRLIGETPTPPPASGPAEPNETSR
jgi:hypothetical protein